MKQGLVRTLGLGGLLAVALAVAPQRRAEAAIVERVVAVVGERPILLSELRHRARPFLFRIIATTPNPAQQAAAESEMFRELLNRMIDDRLEEQAADKAHLSVTSEEVDAALRNIAASAQITVQDLVAEARRQGLTEQDYRDEIRRQVLEGKLVQLRVRGRVRVTEQDARAAYVHWLKDVSDRKMVDVRILALRLAPDATEEQIAQRQQLAAQLAREARGGADFCALVKQYSEDTATRDACGSRGPQPMSMLVPQIAQAVASMREGDVSDPIDVEGKAILVLQLHDTHVPTFEEVRPEMEQRAFGEVMERQRKLWLQELRRGVYVDVRL